MDIPEALEHGWPDATWRVEGDQSDYSNLEWTDDSTPKPSESEVEAAWNDLQNEPDELKQDGLLGDSVEYDALVSEFRDAGANAIDAEQSGDAAAFMRAVIQMEYLQYVALTGDRIDVVEDEYFPVA